MSRPQPTRLISVLAAACLLACPGRAQTDRAQPPPRPAEQPSSPAAAGAAPPAVSSALPLPSPEPAATASERPIRSVLVLGDSLTDEKVGGGIFVRILREHCRKASFDNRAKGGFMVNQMRKRLETEVLPEGQKYSHAIVFGGVNDLYSDQTANRTLPRIEGDLSRIYSALKERGIEVIAVTVTPWGGFKKWFTPERGQNTLTLNRWIQAQPAAGAIASAIDAYPLLSCGEPDKLCPELALPHKDGLHFGQLGHEKLAKALLAGPFKSCEP